MFTFKIIHRRGTDRTLNHLVLIEHRKLNDHPIEVVALHLALPQRHCKFSTPKEFLLCHVDQPMSVYRSMSKPQLRIQAILQSESNVHCRDQYSMSALPTKAYIRDRKQHFVPEANIRFDHLIGVGLKASEARLDTPHQCSFQGAGMINRRALYRPPLWPNEAPSIAPSFHELFGRWPDIPSLPSRLLWHVVPS